MFVRGVIASDRCRSAGHIPVTGFRDAQKRLGGSCCMHFGCSRAPIWPQIQHVVWPSAAQQLCAHWMLFARAEM